VRKDGERDRDEGYGRRGHWLRGCGNDGETTDRERERETEKRVGSLGKTGQKTDGETETGMRCVCAGSVERGVAMAVRRRLI
jgi:hypothetical protein